MKTKYRNIKFVLKAAIVFTLLLNTNVFFGNTFYHESSEQVKAWDALGSSPTLRIVTDNLTHVDNYVKKHPNSLPSVKSNFDGLVEARRKSFLKSLKQAAQEPLNISNARRANPDEISASVNKLADHRGNSSGGNFGYLEGNVNGSSVDDKVWSSGAANPQIEPQIFQAISVSGSSGNSWLRNTDAEYKMLNRLAADLGGQTGNSYPSISGTLKIASEFPYCASCQGVIQQFNAMFPNIDLILIDGVR